MSTRSTGVLASRCFLLLFVLGPGGSGGSGQADGGAWGTSRGPPVRGLGNKTIPKTLNESPGEPGT